MYFLMHVAASGALYICTCISTCTLQFAGPYTHAHVFPHACCSLWGPISLPEERHLSRLADECSYQNWQLCLSAMVRGDSLKLDKPFDAFIKVLAVPSSRQTALNKCRADHQPKYFKQIGSSWGRSQRVREAGGHLSAALKLVELAVLGR